MDMFWALTRLGGSTWGRRHWNGRAQESTKTLQNNACLDHVAKTKLYLQRVGTSLKRQYQKTCSPLTFLRYSEVISASSSSSIFTARYKTISPLTFLSYSELISSSSSSSVFVWSKRCYTKRYSRAKESKLFWSLYSERLLSKFLHRLA